MALERSSSFSQQGSVDWVALSGGFLSISKEILQRLSGSSLDTYTVAVGHVLGSQFRLSSKGRINMQKALDNMNAYAGLQNVLWFGFGVKHPARAIGTTEQGTTLVALCAALAECFPHETAAEILNDMVSLESNLDMTPSVGEWLALIKSCAGILSTTMFSVRAEKLMGLENSDKPADPTDIATVLNAIGKITKHEWVSITIHGGKEARWIGALAEWLFGLTVTITDNQDEVVYTSCPNGQISQVNIRSQTRHDNLHPDYRAPKTGNKTLEIADRTFYIKAVDEVFISPGYKPYGGKMDTPTMNGRVPWENCLSTVFGVLFKELMKRPDQVASVISGAARMYCAIATAEEGAPIGVLETNVLYVESSFGAAFIHNLLQWFPELSAIKQYLDQDSDVQTYKYAASKYRVSIKDIRDNCGCKLCAGLAKGTKEKEVNCQVVLVELILRLGRLLSVVECAEGLYPKFTGLRKLYNMRGEESRSNPKKYLPDPPGVHRYRFSDVKPPKMAPFVAMDNFPSHMEHAICLFTGRTSKDLNLHISRSPAISVDGICIYLRMLREIPDSPAMFAMLHICPGQILHQGKRFTQLTDRPKLTMPHSRDKLEKEEAMFVCALQGAITSVKLAVRETVNQLFIHYDLFLADGDATGLQLQPYSVCENMLTSYRRLSCSHSSDSVIGWGDGSDWDDSKFPELQAKLDEENHYQSWNMQSSDLGRCAVAGLYYDMVVTNCVLVVRDEECLPCCRKVRDATFEVFKADNIIIVDKPDPRRPVRKFT